MKIGIIGAGSIGMLFGSWLGMAGEVTFYVRREEQAEALRKHGLMRINDGWRSSVNAGLFSEMDNQDCLFVCVKQYQLKEILPWIQNRNNQTPVFFIQNGMGHLDLINKLQQPVFFGIVEHGSARVNDYTFSHTGSGTISFAGDRIHERLLKKLVNQLSTPGFEFQVRDDMVRMLSEKLAINAVINPLTAIVDVNNGQICSDPHLNSLAEQLCIEACRVLELDTEVMWCRIMEVAAKTSENTSSMRKDLHEKRKTEIDAISGYIMNHAENAMPYTVFVWHAVKCLEQKGGTVRD